MTRILVTGGSGQVGLELQALAKAQNIVCIAPPSSELDITNKDSAEQAISNSLPFDFVINAAAYTAVDQAETDQDRAFAVNADGARYLAEACAAQNIPLLHISTDYVFDGTKQGAYTEKDTPNPLSVYGASKLAGEEAVREACPQHIILRTAWVFSAHGRNFVKTILRLGKERDVLRIVADQHGCLTSATAIARACLDIIRAVEDGNAAWGTYHFCGSGIANWAEFAAKIFELAKNNGYSQGNVKIEPISTDDYPTAAKRPQNSVLDTQKLAKTFGISPADWETMLEAVIQQLATGESDN